MTKEIQNALPGLASVTKSLDIATLSTGLNKFERLFEDLVRKKLWWLLLS